MSRCLKFITLYLPFISHTDSYYNGNDFNDHCDSSFAAKSRMAKRRLRSRVCLNMIAKDEANDRLVPTLQAAAVHITGYMFCDTGSTDGTPKLAKSIFGYFNLKGKVANHNWKDFSHNRNYCLEDGKRLMGNKCDYWLLLDADQIMVAEEDFGLAELELQNSAYL